MYVIASLFSHNIRYSICLDWFTLFVNVCICVLYMGRHFWHSLQWISPEYFIIFVVVGPDIRLDVHKVRAASAKFGLNSTH